MFATYGMIAEQVWLQLDEQGTTDAQSLAYNCTKRGICSKEEIYSLVANAIPEQVEEHAATIRNEWMRRQEIGLAEKALQRLQSGDDVAAVVHEIEAERDTLSQFSDDKDASRVDRCNRFFDDMASARRGEKPKGVSIGLPTVDRRIGGVGLGGRFSIWAGRPGMGKTTFAFCAAIENARLGLPVVFFALEMSWDEILSKFVQSVTGIGRGDMAEGRVTDTEMKKAYEALAEFHDLPIYVEDAAMNWGQIKNKIRQYRRKYGVRVAYIDYLQLIEDRSQRHQNKTLEVEAITRGMVLTAKREKIDIICLSQLSRAVETRGGSKVPIMSDLRHSGGIEQDAGQILFLYRPDYYGVTEDEEGYSLKGITEVIVAKNRYISSGTGKVKVGYDDRYDRFKPLEDAGSDAVEAYNPNIEPKRNDDEDIPF